MHGLRFYYHLSAAKAFQLCSITNIPLGLDDPDNKSNYAGLLIDLFHGASKAAMTAGEVKPISSILHPMKTKGQQYACAHYHTTVLPYACHFYLIYMTIVADMLPGVY